MASFEITEYSTQQIAELMPLPDIHANKYSRGKLAVVAGCAAYPGAACLAANAAMRAGAGYVQVFCAPQAVPLVQMSRASLVVTPWDALEAEAQVARSKAVVVGPGFDYRDEMCQAVTLAVLNSWAASDAPIVVDGGALGVVASTEGRRALRNRTATGGKVVMTPHAREAARLALPLGLDVPQSEDDREGQAYLVRGLALYYACVVVLKGPVTYISDGSSVVCMDKGTPALAKAGTGDVLAGMIGALLAQGAQPLDAAVVGATWHARAGKHAQSRLTAISVCAEDVIEAIPAAVKALVGRQEQ